jgi:hypothetical protein
VRAYLNSHFAGFVHDQPIHTAHCVCSHRRRIDHRRLIGNTILCVETCYAAHAAALRTSDLDTRFFHTDMKVLAVHCHGQPTVL